MASAIAVKTSASGWLPVEGGAVGLVSWYTPEGPAAAVLNSWLAIIDGPPHELRAGCPGRLLDEQLFPPGTDFAVNVPTDPQAPILQKIVHRAGTSGFLLLDEEADLRPGRVVHVPLLAGCALHIECGQGRILPGEWEVDLAGQVLLLHRNGLIINPAEHRDFCALRPLHPFILS